MTQAFHDHFSAGAGDYARHRPSYPDALFAWIASRVRRRELALDVATGNGQAAVGLAAHFRRVVALDASAEQIRHARPVPNVEYRHAFAHQTGLADDSVDALTVAQALHWLDRPPFYAEAQRVLAPGGLVAVWCYQLMTIAPAIDRVVNHFYYDRVGAYWPPERRLVEDGYASLEFPFRELAVPPFAMRRTWTLDDVAGYIATWSPTRGYREQTGDDPIPALREELLAVWGPPEEPREVSWPLSVRAGTPEG